MFRRSLYLCPLVCWRKQRRMSARATLLSAQGILYRAVL